ncbi:MAG TPA: radical SAM protein [Methylomusa anaerophila]|uniref:Coproporphyrinogen III oxidase n=1 Tax=Methylomusa anaerophila TaxID=1930071 RepID=A0A348AEW5_9FIRM|nr:radical SAM protein [Methylomusa anaerophila]BBB89613.1 coproporphyrinogen III oxidase [Methylomusa anaerophila]HML89614.1 radical SAM protein [Methylomusa anaerophila]
MKILLVNPAFYDGQQFSNRYNSYLDWVKGGNLYVAPFEPPLGLASLYAYLKTQGYQVELIDMQGLLMDSAELAKTIADRQPGLVGVSAMTTTLPAALKVAALTRQAAPAAKVVLGGVHPTLDPAGVLANDSVDFVIRGEGEQALGGLVAALEGRSSIADVAGLCYREGDKSVIKEKTLIIDQDSLPAPAYDSFPVERYIQHNQLLRDIRGVSMLVSRGCPFPCSFCAVHQTMGRKWRVKSANLVVDQIIGLKNKYHLDGIWFKDSILNLNRQWTRDFSQILIERKVDIAWQANTRIDLINEEELQLMQRAGLTQVDLGIESGSPQSLAKLGKGITVDQIKEKVKLARKYVKVFGFFMIGLPGEEEKDVVKTFELAKELKLDRSTWSIYSPLPGSTFYDDLVQAGTIKPYQLDYERIHFTETYEGICKIPSERLKELYREINEYFYTGTMIPSAG